MKKAGTSRFTPNKLTNLLARVGKTKIDYIDAEFCFHLEKDTIAGEDTDAIMFSDKSGFAGFRELGRTDYGCDLCGVGIGEKASRFSCPWCTLNDSRQVFDVCLKCYESKSADKLHEHKMLALTRSSHMVIKGPCSAFTLRNRFFCYRERYYYI